MKVRSIFILILLVFIVTAIIYPTMVYVMGRNVVDNNIYVGEEIVGSKIAYEDFSSEYYFQNTTNKYRPYITENDAISQISRISELNNIDTIILENMIKNNSYNNLFHNYVNINTLNMELYMYKTN